VSVCVVCFHVCAGIPPLFTLRQLTWHYLRHRLQVSCRLCVVWWSGALCTVVPCETDAHHLMHRCRWRHRKTRQSSAKLSESRCSTGLRQSSLKGTAENTVCLRNHPHLFSCKLSWYYLIVIIISEIITYRLGSEQLVYFSTSQD